MSSSSFITIFLPPSLLVLVLLAQIAGLVTAWQVILGRKRGAAATLGWVVTLVSLPFLGLLLYYFLGRRRLRRTRRNYDEARRAGGASYLAARQAMGSFQTPLPREFEPLLRKGLLQLAERVGTRPLWGGNSVSLYTHGTDSLAAIREAILEARHHVHLEYYIFRADGVGRRILDALVEVAGRGVNVRLLVDDVGSSELGSEDTRALVRAGGQVARFNPFWGAKALHHVHLRNHRKILIVDGITSFTGSQNIGDEYAGRWKGRSWKDTHLRIRGPATRCLQEVFWDDWCYATGERRTCESLFPEVHIAGEQWVHVVDSGPDAESSSIHKLLFSAISTAEQSIDLVTPYFIPDPEMLMALEVSAQRGVRVRILVPGRSDNALVTMAARWYYQELIEAGASIWEYQRGMIHAKTVVVDDWWSMVGTANMDQRSFYLNFEVCTLMYGRAVAERLQVDFELDLHHALPVTLERVRRTPRSQRVLSAFARMLSPLL